jgi:hypothetical protein
MNAIAIGDAKRMPSPTPKPSALLTNQTRIFSIWLARSSRGCSQRVLWLNLRGRVSTREG